MEEGYLNLEAIEERVANATPGPWVARCRGAKPSTYNPGQVGFLRLPRKRGRYSEKFVPLAVAKAVYGDVDVEEAWDNAEFIAHAREDIPALIHEVRMLRLLVRGEATVRDVHMLTADNLEEEIEDCLDQLNETTREYVMEMVHELAQRAKAEE